MAKWLRRGAGLFALLICLCAAGCNFEVPLVTPTVAPSLTPTDTALPLASPSHTPTVTSTATTPFTPTPSLTFTQSSTATPVPTDTFTPSATFTDTATPTPTLTHTDTTTALPSATPTPSETALPTFTPTPTDSDTFTPTFTPTNTSSYTPTATPTSTPTAIPPTLTDTPQPTATQMPSDTPSPSWTPTFTATVTPTDTHTSSPTHTATTPPSPTPLPVILLPTATFTPSFTWTLTPSLTSSATATARPTDIPPTLTFTPPPPPTFTPFPTPTIVLAGILPTEAPIAPLGERPERTATASVLQATANAIVNAVGTQNALPPTPEPFVPPETPSFATVLPGTQAALVLTPTPGGNQPPQDIMAVTLTALATLLAPTAAPTDINLILNDPGIPPTLPSPSTRAFALSTVGGSVVGSAFDTAGGAAAFSINPVTNQIARVSPQGAIYIGSGYGDGGARLQNSPFSQFEPSSAETNNAFVRQVAWSPNGVYLAFLVDTDNDGSTQNDFSNDGVWYLEPTVNTATDPTYQLTRDCPPEQGCALINPPERRRSQYFEWNFQSDALLVQVELVDEGRRGFVIVQPLADSSYASVPQPVYRYDYASWSPGGESLIVSGAGPDGVSAVRRLNRATGQETMIFNGSQNGLWVQNAVERTDGQIFMLAGASPSNPLALYNSRGVPVTQPIGNSAPVRVQWSPVRDAVLVVTLENGLPRYFVAQTNGVLQEITAQVADALSIEWVTTPPQGADTVQGAAPPSASAPSDRFVSGQIVRVVYPTGVNLRDQPSTSATVIGGLEFNTTLTIVDGPVARDDYLWWRVLTPNNELGWVAERLDENTPFIAP